MSTVVSVRISKKIKEILESEGIDVSKEVREYLEELAYRIQLRRYVEKWDRILSRAKPSKKGFSEKSVREDRESH